MLIGITPGAQQARNALIEVPRKLTVGTDQSTALSAAKIFASFSGMMRKNLVAMLDHIGPNWPAPGSEDTELGVFMEPEVSHGKTKVYTRVQA